MASLHALNQCNLTALFCNYYLGSFPCIRIMYPMVSWARPASIWPWPVPVPSIGKAASPPSLARICAGSFAAFTKYSRLHIPFSETVFYDNSITSFRASQSCLLCIDKKEGDGIRSFLLLGRRITPFLKNHTFFAASVSYIADGLFQEY